MKTKIIFLFFIMLSLLFPIPVFYVEILNKYPIYMYTFPEGLKFNFTYIHSVEKVPVTMVYEVRGGELMLKEVITTTQAAGTPFYGNSFLFSNGVVIYYSNQTTKEFRVIITKFTFQTVVFDNLEIKFWLFCEDGDRIRFSVEDKPVILYLVDSLRKLYS
ncbi:TPA: DUF1850 domain-containing protein [Candidatus Poribacteria bacterium]|nr:DUF1850 domain-containing protein [Candidatus Poribacteria bacterium]